MGVYTVTFDEYDRFCEEHGPTETRRQCLGSWQPAGNQGLLERRASLLRVAEPTRTGRAYRLPSEAEWEYACRAGTITPFYFGARITTEQANFDGRYTYNGSAEGEYRGKTMPVGSLSAQFVRTLRYARQRVGVVPRCCT